MNEEKLVKALIADHLRHTKLMNGLEKLGFDTLDLYLGLPEIIFEIMGIEKSETIFMYFITAAELACTKEDKEKDVADTLYDDLLLMRVEWNDR